MLVPLPGPTSAIWATGGGVAVAAAVVDDPRRGRVSVAARAVGGGVYVGGGV
jgi:hypothetical protein